MGNHEIGEMTYYVQYILIVTLIMTNFSDTVVLIKETINNLVGFINCLLPILIALMMTTRKLSNSISSTTSPSLINNLHRKLYNRSAPATYTNSELHLA